MKIKFVEIQNFRKLKSCRIDFTDKETIFVGANNSGKTSAMDSLIFFLKENKGFTTREFTLSNWKGINLIGESWIDLKENELPDLNIENLQDFLPQLDVWLKVEDNEIHLVSRIIPTLNWENDLIGIRLRFEPKNIEELYKDFITYYKKSYNAKEQASVDGKITREESKALKLWPKSLWHFLDKEANLNSYFKINSYILDPKKLNDPINSLANPQALLVDSMPLDFDPFKNIIKVDIINAQRGFTDPNTPINSGNLSTQLREYYSKHLNPYEQPDSSDIGALQAIESANKTFDEKLSKSFESSFIELQDLNYPGFGNPPIKISSLVTPIDGIKHDSAIQFGLITEDSSLSFSPLSLPERYNGLGYQNLISMVFKLIRFRDEWMQVGKGTKQLISNDDEFQPLHLILVEEPEAHLHAQVQQVFIKKAYDVLRNHSSLKELKQFTTQLVVSTHSNHIAHEVDFTSLRYFRRKFAESGNLQTSTVVNLSKTFGNDNDSTKFAIRYLKTTHCDLFFADAAILIEGPAERMLIPHFIENHYSELASCYISILEIGGSHAHTLRPLMEDLGLITLIITDIDSVSQKETNSWKATLPERNDAFQTNNDTLKRWLPKKSSLNELLNLNEEDKIAANFPFRVAYQIPIKIELNKGSIEEAIPYTFEDSLVFENIELFKMIEGKGLIKKFKEALTLSENVKKASESMFEALKKGKKAEFALELLFLKDPKSLITPQYIANGLSWLQTKLNIKQKEILVTKQNKV